MNIENKTILITGANRGIGRALVDEALRRGAKKVYAGTRSECARGTSQEFFRPREVAELCHRDAAQRESRRVVPQRDSLQCAERITGSERTG